MCREMKDSGVQWISTIPESWQIKNIKSLLIERKEVNNPIKTDFILSLTKERGVIPYSEKGDVGNKSKEDYTGYKLAYPKDIVLNSMNIIIGSVGISNYFGAVSPVYYMLYPRKEGDYVEYFNYVFQTREFQNNLKGYGNGIMEHRMRIQMNKLNTVLLPYPPVKKQNKIVNYLDKKVSQIDDIILKQKSLIEKYKAYKQSLITETVTKGLNKNVPMKDSGIEWIGEIPNHWNVEKMKYLIDFNPNYSENLNENVNVSFVPMECIGNGYMRYKEVELKDVKGKYTYFSDKDIIMAKVTPCFENGNIAIANDLINRVGFGSSELYVFRCKKVDNKFMFYYLRNNIFKEGCISTMTGTGGLKRVSASFIENYYIGIPEIDEQREIAEFLDKKCKAIDSAISKKEKLIEKLESYKKSLIYECVTGKREVN